MRVNAQLIDADCGAHLWAEQFDTPRADLLQTQDEIVTRLARSMYLQLPEVEASRLKRTLAANPAAEDLALQCQAGFLRNEAAFLAAYYRLCDQALAADPDNVRGDLLGHHVLAFAWPRLRTSGKTRTGRRIGVESARARSKLRSGSPRQGFRTSVPVSPR